MSSRYVCHTNVDEAKQKVWPKDFVVCPRPGDFVRSKDGYILRVCRIVHRAFRLPGKAESYIEVELNQ